MTENEARIRELENSIAERDKTILMLQKSIDNLTRQVENLTEAILQMRRSKFGASSEKTVRSDDGSVQLSLFNEVELEAKPSETEPFKANSRGRATPRTTSFR